MKSIKQSIRKRVNFLGKAIPVWLFIALVSIGTVAAVSIITTFNLPTTTTEPIVITQEGSFDIDWPGESDWVGYEFTNNSDMDYGVLVDVNSTSGQIVSVTYEVNEPGSSAIVLFAQESGGDFGNDGDIYDAKLNVTSAASGDAFARMHITVNTSKGADEGPIELTVNFIRIGEPW